MKYRINVIFFALVAAIGLVTPYGTSVFAAPGDYNYSYSIGTPGRYIGLSNIASASDGSQWVFNAGDMNELIHVSSAGSRLGVIALPTGSYEYSSLTIAPSGVIYVAQSDWSNSAFNVLQYQSDGTLLSTVTLATPGNSYYIYSMAVDAAGMIYTPYNGVIDKFSPTGTHLTSMSGSFGNNIPSMLIQGASLYIVDYYNGRIQQLTLDGTLIQTWNGINYPTGLVMRSDGLLLTATQGVNSFAVLSPSGGVTLHAADRPLSGNNRLGVDQDDNIFVIDATASRLQKFSSAYAYQTSYKVDDNPNSALIYPSLVARDTQSNLYVYDGSNQSDDADDTRRVIRKYNVSGQLIDTIILRTNYQSADGQYSYYVNPSSFAIDSDGSIVVAGWVSKSDNGTSSSYTFVRYSVTGGEPQFEADAQYTNQATGELISIYSIAIYIDPTSRDVYLGGSINSYDPSTSTSRQYQLVRYPGGSVSHPQLISEYGSSTQYSYSSASSLQRGPDGKLYMTGYLYDSVNSKQYSVWRFDPQTQQIEPLVESSMVEGTTQTNTGAYSLAIDRKGNLYVGGYIYLTDTTTNQQVAQYTVAKYSSGGNLIAYIAQSQDPSGTYRTDRINYMSQNQLAVDQYGNVYALDIDSRAKVVKVYLIEPNLPSVPRSVTSSNQSLDAVTINWQEPEDDGNAPITNYIIMAREAGGAWSTVATLGPNARSYRLMSLYGKSLRAGATYEFTIVARNKAGDSPIVMLTAQTSAIRAPSTGAGVVSSLPVVVALGGLTLAIVATILSLLPRRIRMARRSQ